MQVYFQKFRELEICANLTSNRWRFAKKVELYKQLSIERWNVHTTAKADRHCTAANG
jgi:hypothetical protein